MSSMLDVDNIDVVQCPRNPLPLIIFFIKMRDGRYVGEITCKILFTLGFGRDLTSIADTAGY